MSAMGINRELDAADGYPLTIGRGTGCTIKEFNRRLKALMKRKKMQPLTLGGGPARVPKVSSPSPVRKIAKTVSDVWSQL